MILEIKVFPNSGKLEFKLDGDRLKCYLTSTPEKGKANKELISFLAKKLGIRQFDIVILSGVTTRIKRVKIKTNLEFNEIVECLCING
jgi:uncharacterized protein